MSADALWDALLANGQELLAALERRDAPVVESLVRARHGLVQECLDAAGRTAPGAPTEDGSGGNSTPWLSRVLREQEALVAAAEAALSGVGAELDRLKVARDGGRRYHSPPTAPRVLDERR